MLGSLRALSPRAEGRSNARAPQGPFIIVGAGFAGIGLAIRFKQAGIEDFTILEQAGDLGGTWRDNTYPGCACDVPSHLYSFSFELNPHWTRTYAPQAEIWAYIRHCVDKYGLGTHIRFDTRVSRAEFDEASGRWRVHTDAGQTLSARMLFAACGGLNRPAIPPIPGLDVFEGKLFHSARWDHEASLEGKRVGVIGTGASSVQIVPEVAKVAAKLVVFQRTPPWVVPRDDEAIPARERRRYARMPALMRLRRELIYAKLELRALGFVLEPRLLRAAEHAARAFLRRSVKDPALRAKLIPSYPMGCKRVLLSDDYYPALERPNVELETRAIERVTAHAVLTQGGGTHELDALVLATGFSAAEAMAPFEIRGLRGVELSELWREGGEAYLGTTVSGFPNFFVLVGPNTFLAHSSMIFMMESQYDYILAAMSALEGLRYMDVRADVQARYNAELQRKLEQGVWSQGCSNWYLNRQGKNTTVWPGFTFEYRQRLSHFDPSAYSVVR